MNYFYSIIPPEIQEIIIQNVASLIIQEKWLNFINTKLELERYFIRIKPKNMNKYKFNLFDINFVLNIEKASRIITGRNDNEDKWHRILFDIYNVGKGTIVLMIITLALLTGFTSAYEISSGVIFCSSLALIMRKRVK